DPIEVSSLGCVVNGIGEARHADFGITGAKNEGMVYSKGEPLRKVPQEQLVDVLFEEIDKYYAAGKKVVKDEREAAEGAEWLAKIESENAGELTPERLAAMEAAAADDEHADAELLSVIKPETERLDEESSPVEGRRFSRT